MQYCYHGAQGIYRVAMEQHYINVTKKFNIILGELEIECEDDPI